MAVWWMNRMVDLLWQSTNKRSLETVMFRNIMGLLEMGDLLYETTLPDYMESMQNRGKLSNFFEFFILHGPKAGMPFSKRWFQFAVEYLATEPLVARK